MHRPSRAASSRPRARIAIAVVLAAASTATGAVAWVAAAPSAQAADRGTVLRSAAAYGPRNNYKIGIAVYDTKLHRLYGSGAYRSTFASESVIKVMIATRLIWQGRLHGTTERRAYKMITQSDDAIASSLYGSVGGDGLINWIKRKYHVPDLGTPPRRAGWWGNTHITAAGLVKLYAKLKTDRRVGPWLLRAMHRAHRYGSDGTWQFFGLPSATSHAAVKQGWGIDYDDWGRSADFNTTGFVNGDRYAVAILARGPARTYGSAIGNALTQTARRLLPGGRFPDPDPVIRHMSHRSGALAGRQRVDIVGTDFSRASAVLFGGTKGTGLRVFTSRHLRVTTPARPAGQVSVRVVTDHGTSSVHSYYTFVAAPMVTAISPTSGASGGGTSVTVRGTQFTHVTSVWFGAQRAAFKVLSTGTLTADSPAGAAGPVHVTVRSWYGRSPATGADVFTYVAAPSSGTIAPNTGPVAGGTTVTITGTDLTAVTGVLFGDRPGTSLTHVSPDTITVVAPGDAPGAVPVVLQRGAAATVPAGEYTYSS